MNSAHIAEQFRRLKLRFGQKAFDDEFTRLVIREVQGMSDYALTRLVDALIGSRPPSRPPLLDDFRQARLAESKRQHEAELSAVSRTLHGHGSTPDGLKNYLLKAYGPGVRSLWDAVEIERIHIKAKHAEGE